jgi:hypothetical protein
VSQRLAPPTHPLTHSLTALPRLIIPHFCLPVTRSPSSLLTLICPYVCVCVCMCVCMCVCVCVSRPSACSWSTSVAPLRLSRSSAAHPPSPLLHSHTHMHPRPLPHSLTHPAPVRRRSCCQWWTWTISKLR